LFYVSLTQASPQSVKKLQQIARLGELWRFPMHWHSTTFRKFLILITFTSFFCVAAFAQQTATPTITALFKFTCNRKLCSNGIFPKGKLVQARDGKFYGA